MSLIEVFKTTAEYNDHMNRKVWDRIMTLKDEQFIENLGYSHGSIRDLMIHIAVVERRWLRGLQGQPDARGYSADPAAFSTRQQAFEYWDQVARDLMSFVGSLDDSGLELTPIGMLGPVWQVLLHLLNHATDHRSQVLRALTDFGVQTFDQDLILYLWFRE